MFLGVSSQAPTERQLRYKEKVTELRRKRNTGLNKEQKEKYMVSGLDKSVCVIHHISFDCTFLSQISILTSPLVPARHQEHRQSHGTSREPLLENITSDYDLELFRKAQARASDDLVREKTHLHLPLTLCRLPFIFGLIALLLCCSLQTLPCSCRRRLTCFW